MPGTVGSYVGCGGGYDPKPFLLHTQTTILFLRLYEKYNISRAEHLDFEAVFNDYFSITSGNGATIQSFGKIPSIRIECRKFRFFFPVIS